MFAATLPYPPRSGADLRVLATVLSLAAEHDVSVFALSGQIGRPIPDRHVVAYRACTQFAEDGGRLRSGALRWLRDPEGHPSDGWFSESVLAELATLAGEVQTRVVVLDSLWLHRYIEPLRELGHFVVLSAHGIEAALHDELVESNPSPLTRTFAQRTHKIEARAFLAVDQLWVPSPHDAQLARDRYGRSRGVAIVPNAIDLDDYPPALPTERPFTVAYSASFAYPPNVSASRRLLGGIFPELRRRVPDARLALIGRDPTSEMRTAAARDDRIEVTGQVDDVSAELRRASVMAVPLTEGHGTRFKILEAFATGLPVVSSSKGVQGIEADPGLHYLAAETDAEFADALALLARDRALAAELSRRGFELVRARYSLDAVREAVGAALASEIAGG